MKSFVSADHWDLTTNFVHDNDSIGNGRRYIKRMEYELLRIVLQELNMTYVHVPTPKDFQATHSEINVF